MFQFPGFAFYPYVFRIKYLLCDNWKSEGISAAPRIPEGILAASHMTSKFQLSKVGFPIRKSAGQRLFAPHHSLSQRTTSFIASYRQGIHQMPLGHLIALISNARRFTTKPNTPLEGCVSFLITRLDEHCSERPEVEINPANTACAASGAPGVSPLYDVHDLHR